MPNTYVTFKIHLPDGPDPSDNLQELRRRFMEMVEHAGGKVPIQEVLPAYEDLAINRWIVDDWDTQAATGIELLMALGDIADESDNKFGNMIFEDEFGVIHRAITTWEFLQVTDPEERADLLANFRLAPTSGKERS